MLPTYNMETIGVVESPYKEKFAIPRQPGLVPEAKGFIRMVDSYNREEYLRGLANMSHIWVVFVFHQHIDAPPKPLIRPPRLGGNKKIGVFASRSTYRPNPIGLSVVQLEGITQQQGQWCLQIQGLDLLDGTPVLDIKPYIPYADIIPDANADYASTTPTQVRVRLTPEVTEQARSLSQTNNDWDVDWEALIVSVLQQDPRPAYKQTLEDTGEYGMTLYNQNIRWRAVEGAFEVFSMETVKVGK